MAEFKYYIHNDALDDIVFDEKGNQFLAMRRVQWDPKGNNDKDESKAKLELRKWINDKDGNEVPNKGFSFLTEEGPHNLANKLVEKGYGDTRDILTNISKRDDFKSVLENKDLVVIEEDNEYFNPNEYLQNLLGEVKEDE